MCLREIGKVPLLTAAQEVDLAMRIEGGELAAGLLASVNAALCITEYMNRLARAQRELVDRVGLSANGSGQVFEMHRDPISSETPLGNLGGCEGRRFHRGPRRGAAPRGSDQDLLQEQLERVLLTLDDRVSRTHSPRLRRQGMRRPDRRS